MNNIMKNMGLVFFVFLFFLFFSYYIPSSITAAAEQKPSLFSTWEGFEVDKCASIWLIKRHIDKNAIIKFFPKGQIIEEGTPFDTPDAQFRRYHNMSTFESLLKHYNLSDPKLIYMGKIIHDIEVNIWEKKVYTETLSVQEAINNIILNSKSSEEIIEKSIKYFDLLYKHADHDQK